MTCVALLSPVLGAAGCRAALSSSDAVCARHAMALATLLAQSDPKAYADLVGPQLDTNLKLFRATGAERASRTGVHGCDAGIHACTELAASGDCVA